MQDLSVEKEQQLLDLITCETQKLKNLDKNLTLEIAQETEQQKHMKAAIEVGKSKSSVNSENKDDDEKDAEEKRALLQAVISEAQAAGSPMTPSLVKLLNNATGTFLSYKYKYLGQ